MKADFIRTRLVKLTTFMEQAKDMEGMKKFRKKRKLIFLCIETQKPLHRASTKFSMFQKKTGALGRAGGGEDK